jgi:hypothetical membrane protein
MQAPVVSKTVETHRRAAGWLLFASTVQFSIAMIIAESLYPGGYVVSAKYISDLGVGSTGSLFDTSISLVGIAVIIDSYFLYKIYRSKIFSILILLNGIGALSVGIFNESFGNIHGYVSLLTFVAGALTSIVSYRYVKSPFSYMAVVLGVFSLLALVTWQVAGSTLGLGVGGIERMVVYPFLLFGVGFGAYLIGSSNTPEPSHR